MNIEGEGTTDTLRDTLAAAMEPATDTPIGDAAPSDDPNAPPPVEPDLPPFDIPQHFPAYARPSLETLAKDRAMRAHADAWLKHYNETEGFKRHIQSSYDGLQRAYDPIRQLIEPHIPVWQRNGQTPHQVIGQLLGWAQQVQTNPNDAIRELAKISGVDLSKLVADQPYKDPDVLALEQRMEQQERQRAQQQHWHQLQQQHAANQYLAQQMDQFKAELNADGTPKYAHFDKLAPSMAQAIMGGFVQATTAQEGLRLAYEFAMRNDPQAQKEAQAEAERKAAAERAAAAKKAIGASTQGNVTGKGGASKPPDKNLRDELAAQWDAAQS